MSDLLSIAEEAWGSPVPDWVRALALACERSSQSAVARLLGRAPAVVSTVLRNKYGADTARIEERVRGVLMDGKVDCPGMGLLPSHECQDWREKARVFAPGNPTRTRMYRACHRCPVFKKESGE